MAIQSSFSLTGTLFKAAATGTAAAAAVQWSGHLIRCIQNLQTTPIGIVGTVSGGVVLVSALTDAAVQKFLSGVFKLKNKLALELFGTAVGLMGGYATTGLMQYEMVPLSLATGSPLVVLGCTAFLLWKLSQNSKQTENASHDEISKLKEELEKSRKSLEESKKAENASREEITKLKKNLEVSQESLEKIQQNEITLQSKLETARKKIQKIEDDLKKTKEEKQKILSERMDDEGKAKLKQLKDTMEKQEQNLGVLNQKVSTLQEELQQAQSRVKELQQEILQKDKELQELREKAMAVANPEIPPPPPGVVPPPLFFGNPVLPSKGMENKNSALLTEIRGFNSGSLKKPSTDDPKAKNAQTPSSPPQRVDQRSIAEQAKEKRSSLKKPPEDSSKPPSTDPKAGDAQTRTPSFSPQGVDQRSIAEQARERRNSIKVDAEELDNLEKKGPPAPGTKQSKIHGRNIPLSRIVKKDSQTNFEGTSSPTVSLKRTGIDLTSSKNPRLVAEKEEVKTSDRNSVFKPIAATPANVKVCIFDHNQIEEEEKEPEQEKELSGAAAELKKQLKKRIPDLSISYMGDEGFGSADDRQDENKKSSIEKQEASFNANGQFDVMNRKITKEKIDLTYNQGNLDGSTLNDGTEKWN